MSDCDYNKDCSKVPIRKKCVPFCLERTLRTATVEEKQLILGLDQNLSFAIYNAYNGLVDINSFEGLSAQLAPEQIETLLAKFEQINQYQLNYFRKSRSERESIIRAIKNLGLDSDNEYPRFS
jgi:hypothetical protein